MTGPDHWADTYKTCRGKYQSPIDIDEHHVTRVHLPPIRYEGFETPPLSSTITNNGHTGAQMPTFSHFTIIFVRALNFTLF